MYPEGVEHDKKNVMVLSDGTKAEWRGAANFQAYVDSHPEFFEFIKEKVKPHGIISTNGHVLKHAKHLEIFTIQRLFILDSISIETGLSIAKTINPDAIEILPGIAYKAVELIKHKVSQPLITGGLIYSHKDAVKALAAGVIGVSTTSRDLWDF